MAESPHRHDSSPDAAITTSSSSSAPPKRARRTRQMVPPFVPARGVTIAQACRVLGDIDYKTLRLWCVRAGVAWPERDHQDQRLRKLPQKTVDRLARLHGIVPDWSGASQRDVAARPERESASDETLADLAPTSPAPPPRPPMPALRRPAAWAEAQGLRTSRYYTSFWEEDVRQARAGLLQFVTWAKLCGLSADVAASHARRGRQGELPSGLQLTFERVPYVGPQGGTTRLRYVNAVQRGAWLGYWQHLGRVTVAPTEEEVQEALDTISRWLPEG